MQPALGALRNRDTIDPMASAAAVVLPTTGFITRDQIPCWGSRMRPAEPHAASCEITCLAPSLLVLEGTEQYRMEMRHCRESSGAVTLCLVRGDTHRFCQARETSTKEFNLAQKPEPWASAVSSFCGPQQQRAAGHDRRSVEPRKP